MDRTPDFAAMLRGWRRHRGMSQLTLAHEADVSQRHVSFLELGRTKPSRDMVLRLAGALDLPLREQNALLLAAGYAPIWRRSALGSTDMAIIDQALDFMLAQHEPFPAFVIDHRWNLLRTNVGGQHFAGFLTDQPPFAPDPAAPINLADAFLAPQPMRPKFVNWRDVAGYFIRSVRANALAEGTSETRQQLEGLLGYPDVRAVLDTLPAASAPAPALTMEIDNGDTRMKLFTTLASLGMPLDVTAQEIRVECFFPADDASATVFRRWAETDRQLL